MNRCTTPGRTNSARDVSAGNGRAICGGVWRVALPQPLSSDASRIARTVSSWPETSDRATSWQLEVRVLDQSHVIAKGVLDAGHENPLANVLHVVNHAHAIGRELLERRSEIVHAPIGDGPTGPRFPFAGVRVEPELEPADVVAHVERLIEVR